MKRASQKNAPKGGENFRIARPGSGDGGSGGRGGVGKVIGPKSVVKAISNGSLNRGNVGNPGGKSFNHLGQAPYYADGYEGSRTKDETRKPV